MTARTHEISIRLMEGKDAQKILELINIEGWNYHISEIERILRASPGTSIVACKRDLIIGGITAATFGNRCILGHVVIESDFRGKGIGSLLIESLIEDESNHGVEIFDVFSIEKAIPFYRRHGFHLLEVLNTYAKAIEKKDWKFPHDPRIRTLTKSDIKQMCDLDQKVSGFQRKNLFKILMQDFPRKSKGLFKGSKLIGFAQARDTIVMCDIGPWIMIDPNIDDANCIIRALISELPIGRKAISGVSESNDIANKTLSSVGFEIELFNYRLVRSKLKVEPFTPGTLAISAFELG